MAEFLAAAVRSRFNIIVTGGVNAGKTSEAPHLSTFLRVQQKISGTNVGTRVHPGCPCGPGLA